ncbi:unnamed protein product [Rhizophagus irregularis]|nr:unnamed protein product [Rhizophagus irregularis]
MLDIAAVLSERGHNVILITSGNYTPASEYPTIKQISFGPAFDVKKIRNAGRALNKPVVGFMSYLNAMDLKTYKSDPLFRCNISLENESFLERSKMGIEQVFMSPMRLAKNSLVLIDTFFGFELPQTVPPNIQFESE